MSAMHCVRLHALASAILLASSSFLATAQDQSQSLAGDWRFALDPRGAGVGERWYSKGLPEQAKLPGTLSAQGIGDPPSLSTPWRGGIVNPKWHESPVYAPYTKADEFRFPFWLQPETYYAGAAWFQRDIEIPESWAGQRVILTLERPHWQTRVWLNEHELGFNNGLSTPHVYELGHELKPGKYQLTIRVDNGVVVDVGENSHCVTDHTQGNWNGIAGDIRLEAGPGVWVADLQAYPSLHDKVVTVRGQLGKASASPRSSRVSARVEPKERVGDYTPVPYRAFDVAWDQNNGTFEFTLPVSDARGWDEFTPYLYQLTVRADDGEGRTVTFGFRDLAAEGRQLLLNGRKLFLRGTLECSIFPLTGHPPTQVADWKRIIKVAKAHGLNHIRFHSYCPPEAAFVAADELGFYYQVETCWANQTTTIGDGKPVDQWVYEETDRILKAYGNHPSFMLMPYGNEPGGGNANAYLAKYVSHYRSKDPRRLWTSGAGWPQLPENQFHVTPDPRVQGWGEGLKSRINAKPPETRTDYRDYIQARSVPVVSHEIGQWCVYPNFDEIPKYKGYLKPKNFEIFRDSLNAHHMGSQARDFLIASGKLQALCYKEDIEAALRTPEMAGFQLLDLHDFPGQGTALVGVLDPFWDEKGYITAEEFRRFCNSTVPLARLGKRVFSPNERFEADLELAHFGPAPLKNAVVSWKIEVAGRPLAEGKLPCRDIAIGNGMVLGRAQTSLDGVKQPSACKFIVRVDGTEFENDWDFWVYPAPASVAADDLLITTELNQAAEDKLAEGGKVLLTIAPKRVKGDQLGRVALGFSSIFWNTAWTGRQPPHTLGVLCDPDHALFRDFPTEPHSNWQWWYIVSRAGAMILDDLPANLRPTIQVIDDWVTNRKLGLLFEAKVGRGKLLVSSIDLADKLEENPVARQLRSSILAYMDSRQFRPSVAVTVEQVRSLMTVAREGLATVASFSSEARGHEAENAVDGDPATFWHSSWEGTVETFPHELIFAMRKPVQLKGVSLLQRQDGNHNGWIKDFEIYLSEDGNTWGEPAVKKTLPIAEEPHEVLFDQLREVHYLKLVVRSGYANGPWGAVAEVEFLR